MLFGEDDDHVAGVIKGRLHTPGDRFELVAQGAVLHDDEAPRLGTDRAGRETATFEDGSEIVGADGARRVVIAGGNTAVEDVERLRRGQDHEDSPVMGKG